MIIVRKGYGLGAMAMAGGSFRAPQFTVAWPTGEIGGMGLEGAVRLGFSKELGSVADPAERQRLFDKLVAAAYQHGKALRSATTFELDDVIDPRTPGPGSQALRSLRGQPVVIRDRNRSRRPEDIRCRPARPRAEELAAGAAADARDAALATRTAAGAVHAAGAAVAVGVAAARRPGRP